MQTRNKITFALVAIALALVFTTCGDLENIGNVNSSADNAAAPVITKQPVGGRYRLGATDAVLTVEATVEEGGTTSYQWYKATDEEYDAGGGTAIPGAAGATYTIDLEEGQWKVYVKVTNTNNAAKGEKTATVKSVLVSVIINDPNNAEFPWIESGPASTGYEFITGGSVTADPISVDANVLDGGTLSYQWYSSETYSSENGTPVTAGTGGTSASYTPPAFTATGTFYYYVVITNTKTGVTGRDTSETASSPAVIKVVSPNATITVGSEKQQYVRGFGVMSNFFTNAPQESLADYEKMFNPKSLGYNIVRIMIPVDNTNEPTTDMKKIMDKVMNREIPGSGAVSGESESVKDRSIYYDIVKLVNGYGGYALASPWSPPREWKTNNSINGGGSGTRAELKKEFWQDYADYLNDFARIMYNNGAPVYAVSIQNEPNFAASYDGCEWTGAQMRDFFKQVGRFTDGVKGWGGGKEIPTVLTMFGESANSPTDSDYGIKDPAAHKYIDIYARHLYGSQTQTRAPEAQAAIPPREMWMTEHNINADTVIDARPFDSTYSLIWKFLNSVDVSIRQNNENAYIWWHGKRFYSMIGDGLSGTVNGDILTRGWALAHYAKFANETWRVSLTVSGNSAGGAALSASNINPAGYDVDSVAARATAFMSPDGNSISLVLFTPTDTSGNGGIDMGTVKIAFPNGFFAKTVTALRSYADNPTDKTQKMGLPDTDTVLLKGGTAAVVTLPRGHLLSVKFTK